MAIVFAVPGNIAGFIIYGGPAPSPVTGGLSTVGLLYSLIIWPTIWTFAEDNTYSGYSLPRLEALTGKKWLAVAVVGVFAVLQHLFVPWPVVLDWRAFVPWVVSLVPTTVFLYWVYCRLDRCLLPGHVAHWLTDVVSMAVLLLPSFFGRVMAVALHFRPLKRSGEHGASPGQTDREIAASDRSTLYACDGDNDTSSLRFKQSTRRWVTPSASAPGPRACPLSQLGP
jgi:hypothetical protein